MGAPGGSANRPAPLTPSVAEALAAGADLTMVDTARDASTDAERITALDDALRTVQEQARPGTRLVIASLADDEAPGPQMAVLPAGTTSARGTSDGLVIGDSTHQPGLAQLTDLTPTLVSALAGRHDPAFDGQALTLSETGRAGTATAAAGAATGDARISRLADDALHARASQATVMRAGALLMGLAVALLVWAAVALRDPGASRREPLRRRVTRVAVYLSTLPTALLLVNAVPWWRVGARAGSPRGGPRSSPWLQPRWSRPGLRDWPPGSRPWRGGTGGPSLPPHRVRRPQHSAPRPPLSRSDPPIPPPRGEASAEPQPDEAGSPAPALSSPSMSGASLTALLVAVAIPLAWLVDAAAGAPLAFNNPLGMNAVVAGRFYGVSNTAFALVAGALVVVIAGVWATLGGGRRSALLVTALLGGAALLVDGAPQLGGGRGRRPDAGADAGLPRRGPGGSAPELAALADHRGRGGPGGGRVRRSSIFSGPVGPRTWDASPVRWPTARPPACWGARRTHWSAPSSRGRSRRSPWPAPRPSRPRPCGGGAGRCGPGAPAQAPTPGSPPAAHGDMVRAEGPDSCPPTRGVPLSGRWGTTALKSLGVLTLVAVLVNDSGVTMAGFILAAAAPALLALMLLLGNSFTASRHLHRRRRIVPGAQGRSSTSPS